MQPYFSKKTEKILDPRLLSALLQSVSKKNLFKTFAQNQIQIYTYQHKNWDDIYEINKMWLVNYSVHVIIKISDTKPQKHNAAFKFDCSGDG